ncbi:MAG: VIT1/CCC1 family protein [candidate division KSB1 bacterium]|nr:VIT1/CCC1 family protein [candidate division KSB1 bacterium]MDZ7272830.1 VIT1/CCC1 family protein [candidate division KSB1 bacterium]MDZ7284147.1 VIT1/CCC1 family protein [candidate division KSB1 bacterium]MDZ7297455.1 VIT1/CCC1 family protein [candidate division KSB1 bacterium]MDZ7305591.1 VIT1/CCC1 family protein [candidate division KSB1 bacterium]
MPPRELLIEYCEDEFTDYLVYQKLAQRENQTERRQLLLALSRQEQEHYEFWRDVLDGHVPRPRRLVLHFIVALRYLFGLTFAIKFLERHEKQVIEEYRRVRPLFEGQAGARLERMIADEEQHENFFIGQINESVVKYLGFIVLGLADAIIEITGVHAGFLGVTSSTTMAGVAGLIVGFAAAISMATAAYLQAKQGSERNPLVSALLTGFSYLLAVVFLALPYFLTARMLLAFLVSLGMAMLLTAYFTFYSAVLFDRHFGREFVESTLLTFGTAIATYFFGEFLGRVFGLPHYAS